MSKFMPQYMFNLCAVTAVKISSASNKSILEAATILSDNYNKSYQDSNLAKEIALAASKVTEFITKVLPNSSIAANMTQLQFTIVNFEPDGNKRKKKLFGGTLFTNEHRELTDKVQECVVNITTYHLLLVGGSLPLAPDGWSINT